MAWALNILFPGAGLILRRREWLGLCHAVLFALCANFAIAGLLIAPVAIPAWLSICSALLAAATWAAAQALLARHIAAVRRRTTALAALAAEARASIEAGRLDVARVALESALAIDEKHGETAQLLARLRELEGGT